MTGENQNKVKHPAPFPEELPLRCMKMLSYTNAVVYDPFMGSGTTAVVAVKTGRSFIGSEISAEYCSNANKRIEDYTQQIKLF
jgi:site-specific DNA-methyltransferase (adenine-specific)